MNKLSALASQVLLICCHEHPHTCRSFSPAQFRAAIIIKKIFERMVENNVNYLQAKWKGVLAWENKWIKTDLKSRSTREAYNLTLEKLFLTLKFTKFNMIICISNNL